MGSSTKPEFTVHWEPWYCLYSYARHTELWETGDQTVEEPTKYLLDLLRRHQIKATWYLLGFLEDQRPDLVELIRKDGHTIGCHSYYHTYKGEMCHGDRPYYPPRFRGKDRLFSGGFWLRLMPYWWTKREVLKTGTFFIHPYDLLFESPINLPKRTIGLGTARDKLERLCREVEFATPVLQPA